jgi:hypothetical protein
MAAALQNFQRIHIRDVLLFENARGERLHRVVVAHVDAALHDDRSAIECLVDKVNRAPGDFHAMRESLCLRIDTGKRRQQRRMNVDDAIRIRSEKQRAEQAHVTGESDEIGTCLLQHTQNFTLVCGTIGEIAIVDHQSGVSPLACPGDPGRVGAIGNHHGDLGIQLFLNDGLMNRREIRSPS